MMADRIFIILEGDNRHAPIGGVKQVYRHVDVLNSLGYNAAVLLDNVNLTCQWFENKTRVVDHSTTHLQPSDIVVLPEGMGGVPAVPGIEHCRIVIYSQNPFMMFIRGFGGLNNVFKFYQEKKPYVICASEHAQRHISEMLPYLQVSRIFYSFGEPFALGEKKEKVIAYMPRRRGEDLERVLAMLNGMGCLKGWRVEPIVGKSEKDTADILKRAVVFMAGGYLEGWGMPVSESMLCGCVVVGWHGYGGEEMFKPEFSFPVPDNDLLEYAKIMKAVLSKPIEELVDLGRKASEFVKQSYSKEVESKSILQTWQKILEPSESSMKDVATMIVTNNEGPYLENILRWMSPRVGRIYVAECKTTFAGTSFTVSRTKSIVDKVGVDNITYMEPDIEATTDPMKNDALVRNAVIERMQKDGFRWAWIVDADEFYCDVDADKLWKFFFDIVANRPDVCGGGCKWYTYWRSVHYKVEPMEPYIPDIIARTDMRFGSSRGIIDRSRMFFVPPEICTIRHYSWAKSPSDIKRKISTWGHVNEVSPHWYNDVFMQWKPDSGMTYLHPTSPKDYTRAVRCELTLPEALRGHPYVGRDLIQDHVQWKHKIKAIILNHNKPENSDKLYRQLAPVFDDVEIWDSGSDYDKIPIHLGRSFSNIYWTGTWNEAMKTCSDYDAVWILGCDITLKNDVEAYRKSLEESLPFGCWSPAIEGRAHPFMRVVNGKKVKVRNIEGMALAVSGTLMKQVGELVKGSEIGFGQDFWLCYCARKSGLPNYIDGSLVLHHPEGIGYDEAKAHEQMETAFSAIFGKDFRRTGFEYNETYEGNIMEEVREVLVPEVIKKPFTIVTVDNGWSYPEFVRITLEIPEARKIVMVKGVSELSPTAGIDIMKYDESLTQLIAEADVAFFPKVGASNKQDYLKLLEAGVPTVVNTAYQQGVIDHMRNGFVYQEASWAIGWLRNLMNDVGLRRNVRDELKKGIKKPDPMMSVDDVAKVCPPCAEKMKQSNLSAISPEVIKDKLPLVSVITPTYHREIKVIQRSIGCMKLQTVDKWEQLVCSDGEDEPEVRKMIEALGDVRVKYHHTVGKKQGDFGNTVRSEMLKKAVGKYVIFLDDDNIILPEYLEKMMKALESDTTAEFVACKIMHFGPLNEAEEGKPPKILMGSPVKLYHVDPLQIMVRREIMLKVGWDTDVGYLSDGVTLEKLGKDYKGIRVEEVLGIHI